MENADESLAIIEPQYNMKRSPTLIVRKVWILKDLHLLLEVELVKGNFQKLGFSHLEK